MGKRGGWVAMLLPKEVDEQPRNSQRRLASGHTMVEGGRRMAMPWPEEVGGRPCDGRIKSTGGIVAHHGWRRQADRGKRNLMVVEGWLTVGYLGPMVVAVSLHCSASPINTTPKKPHEPKGKSATPTKNEKATTEENSSNLPRGEVVKMAKAKRKLEVVEESQPKKTSKVPKALLTSTKKSIEI
nr:hypothetical protein Iba_scaffold10073CG0330 [Ipomoea batatas]